jgi:hypothetical protein
MAATAHLTLAAPDNEKFTVQSAPARLPRRKPNAEYRSRGVDTRTIQAYLGHKSIQHTVRYTELAPTRFKSLFRD